MRYFISFLSLIFLFSFSVKKEKKAKASNRKQPKLVVGIVVDQMRYDYLARFESKYSDNGFKKLMRDGFHCDAHYFSYMPTFTGPGHASVFSGTTPEIHGIIANDWYDKELKREIYCAEDSTVLCVGADSKKERRSPKNMLVTSLGDQIKMASSYRAKSIGISIKDRSAIFPAGKMADGAFWFKGGDEGKFITSTYYMEKLPKWVSDFNTLKKVDEYLSQSWETLLPIAEYTESNPDMNAYELGLEDGESDPVFPYDLNSLKDKLGYSLIKTVPFGDDLLVDFAKAAIEGEELGQDSVMDWLTVSFSSPDYIGHKFGPRSIEIEDTYLRLDLNIADLINYLDEKVGKGEYVIFLTADHGAAQVPQELMDNGVEVGYYNPKEILANVNAALKSEFGADNLIESFSNFQFFLNREVMKKNGLEMNAVCKTIVAASVKQPSVKSGMIRRDLERNQYTDRVEQTVQKGWNTKRSGDVALIMEPGWISNYYAHGGTTHGSPWTYDTHVPLLFYGFGIESGYTNKKTSVEDIVPTVAAIIGVQPPMGCTGVAIDDVLK